MANLSDEYHFIRRLGSGAEGEVWLAEDLRRDRQRVAWKQLHGGDGVPAEFQLLQGVSHPSLSPVLDSGMTPGVGPWFASPHFAGHSLRELPTPLDPALLEAICERACQGLESLNDHGLRHGDLKPAHLLWRLDGEDLQVRLIDLGHASRLDAKDPPRVGTPPYAAAELWETPARPTRNTDLYALAMAALESLRGGPVLPSGSLEEWRQWHRSGDREAAFAEVDDSAPASFLDALRASLSPDPADRPRDAAALRHRLRGFARGADRGEPAAPIPLIGRDDWLRDAAHELSGRTTPCAILAVRGPAGSGRSRLLRALAARVQASGGVAIQAPAEEPVHERVLSSLSLEAPQRVLFVDDVSAEHFDRLVAGWRRLRALPGTPAPQLVFSWHTDLSANARQRLTRELASIAGPLQHHPIPPLDPQAYRELIQELGGDPSDSDRRWRESGGAPGALFPDEPIRSHDFTDARAALGEPLGHWLTSIPTAVPIRVLHEATGLTDEELAERLTAAGELAPTTAGVDEHQRILPWPAPASSGGSSLQPLADAWRERDGDTGAWAALVLESREGRRPDEGAWRGAVERARARQDLVAIFALADAAPDADTSTWLRRDGRFRSGDGRRVREEIDDALRDRSTLSPFTLEIAARIVESTDGPMSALPLALERLERSPDRAERVVARIQAARLAHDAGDRTTSGDLLSTEIESALLPPASILQWGMLLWWRGDRDGAIARLDEALDRARGGVAPEVVSGVLSGRSGLARQTGDLSEAERLIRRAIRYARLAGFETRRAGLVMNHGAILHSLRRTDESLAAYRRAEQLLTAHPDRTLEAHAQLGLGALYRDRGDLIPALMATTRAVRQARASSATTVLAIALSNLGEIELLTGQPRRADHHREELFRLCAGIENPGLARQAKIAYAASSIVIGELDRAGELLDAVEENPGLGGLRFDAWAASVRAQWHHLRGEPNAALRSAAHALRDALRSGRSYTAAPALGRIARLVAQRGDRRRATALLTRGIELARQDPCPPLSRIPLEIARLQWERTEGAAERWLAIARESLHIGLAEEFLIAVEALGDAAPEELLDLATEKRRKLATRYGAKGLALLSRRREGLETSPRTVELPEAPAPAPRKSAPTAPVSDEGWRGPRPIDEILTDCVDDWGAEGASLWIRPARAWRAVASFGHPTPRPVQPPEETEVGALIDAPDWTWWSIPGQLPAAYVVRSADSRVTDRRRALLGELGAAVLADHYRGELEKDRKKLRKLRSELRDLRAQGVHDREQLETRMLTQRLDVRDESRVSEDGEHPLIARAESMLQLRDQLERWVDSPLPILLWGESGTGKSEILAQLEERRGGPFITENCAALPEPLLEAELFGYVPGAFTGADREHDGLFARSSGGTLVLDHLDELTPDLQAKLLRVLDRGRYRPLGADEEQEATFRIAATLRDEPATLLEDQRLRPELYYRLQGIEARVPPLRERREEIVPLLETYLAIAARVQARPTPTIHPDALRALVSAPWPGNVRELINATQRWLIEGKQIIERGDLETPLETTEETPRAAPLSAWHGEDWRVETDRFHRALLEEALARFAGNQTQTAQALGISRRHLQNLLNKLGFRDGDPAAPDAPPGEA